MVTIYNILKKIERPFLIAFGIFIAGVLAYQVGKMVLIVLGVLD